MVNKFKDIIKIGTQDITAMNGKRSLQARQDCLNVKDVEKCLEDLGDIVSDPSEILGDKKKRQSSGYSDSDQQGVCNAFRSVSDVPT